MKVHVIDNFVEDAAAERTRALASEFKTVSHNKLEYRGISLLDAATDEATGRIAKILFGENAPSSQETFFRRYLEAEENETFIHSDVLIGTFTGILFLNPPEQCRGGLAFWKHRPYGWETHPTGEQLQRQGLTDTPELWKSIYRDGFEEWKWEMTDYVPMAWNRLVLFHSPRFHSRYPQKTFGTELENARLIRVFFLKA